MGRSRAKCPLTALSRADDPLRVALNVWIDPLPQHLWRIRHITAVTWESVCQQLHLTIYTRTHTHTHTHKHTDARTRTHTHTHTHTHKHTDARTHARTHTHTHARTHARANTRTHAHTHTHMMMSLRNWLSLKEYYEHFPPFLSLFSKYVISYVNIVCLK